MASPPCSRIKIISSIFSLLLLQFTTHRISSAAAAAAATTNNDLVQNVDITWGNGRGRILDNGDVLTLSLDTQSGSGFQSKNQYLFGHIGMQLKLVPGKSAGTVTAFYLSSDNWDTHDEIDFEFLGNITGEPYTVHTNVYTEGKGGREQQFHLWFDPTADFHTYSVLWNPRAIVFYVDSTPVREFRNLENKGVPFPKNQGMKLYSSIWNADDWATRGGLVKTDWTRAPFTASYRNFYADACSSSGVGGSNGDCGNQQHGGGWMTQELDPTGRERLRWVQTNYMIYNYCTDAKRFPQGFPAECFAN